MILKTLILTCFLSVFFVSCKTSSAIITSKQEAQKLGVYKAPKTQLLYKPEIKELQANVEPVSEKAEKITQISEAEETDYEISSDKNSYLAEQIVTRAKQYEGINYRYGGTSIDGIDCSAYVLACYGVYNINLPRTSIEMSRTGKVIDKSEAKKGDLIFFKTTGKGVISHVGIVIDTKDGEVTFMHASTHKGVTTSSTNEGYYNKAFAQINRILE